MSDATTPAPDLTGRQRNTMVIIRSIAPDIECNSTRAKAGTGALLGLVAAIIDAGREAEAAVVLRAWQAEREG